MDIFNIKLSKLKKREFLENLRNPSKKSVIFTPNPEILLEGKKDSEFKEILNSWDYLIPDWIWIYAAFQAMESKLPKALNLLAVPYYWLKLFTSRKTLYKKYWERICWSDLTEELIRNADKKGLWVTIIDKFQAPWNKWDNLKIERQKSLIKELEAKFPNAIFHQYIYIKDNEDKIVKEINSTWDIYLFSSQGLKDQEKTIASIAPKLENIKVLVWIWWSFDMILWHKKRAPRFMIALWLEWLWRLLINPKRMIKRIWKAIFVFLWEVIMSK